MKNLSYFLVFAGIFSMAAHLSAQTDKSKRPSPPAQASATIGDLKILIDYSQPSVKGRTIWGMLVPYGKVWRTGANEATTFQVNRDVLIEGKMLPAGKYALFSIPDKSKWTLIFNKQPDQWGAYNYEAAEDALRVQVDPQKADAFTEQMTFKIKDLDEERGKVSLQWENIHLDFNLELAE